MFSIGIRAQTYVSGGIFTNTTWTLSNSPYIVINTLTLFPGDTLTIEPGVVVKFDSSVMFEVRGALLSVGVLNDSILFTSSSSNPQMGIWFGINIRNDLGGSGLFNYSILEDAYYAVQLNFGSMGGPLNIRNSKFENNYVAFPAGAAWNTIIDSCFFINNHVAITGGYKVVTSSIFVNNNYGLSTTENVDVYNCTFCGNEIALMGGRGNLQNCIIMNNGIGVASQHEGFNNVSGNIIAENDTGIILNSYGNISYGIATNNKICNNYSYNLINLSNLNINVSNNCWCETDSTTIAYKIYDGYDNVTYGLIEFTPVLICDTSVLPDSTICDKLFTGISPVAIEDVSFILYPNPNQGSFTLKMSRANDSEKSITVLDMVGKTIWQSQKNFTTEVTIDISHHPRGIYFVKVTEGEKTTMKKIAFL